MADRNMTRRREGEKAGDVAGRCQYLVRMRAVADLQLTDAEFERVAVLQVPALLSVATTARLLDCSPRTVRRRIAERSLPAVVDHGRVMVRADELREYIDALDRPGGVSARRRRSREARGRFDFLRE
jgi:excisionase family DNA binding protein